MLTDGYRPFGTAYQVQSQGAVKGDNYTTIVPHSLTDAAIVRTYSEKCSKGKGKDKVHLRTSHEGPEGE
jgi:hypothetical protein